MFPVLFMRFFIFFSFHSISKLKYSHTISVIITRSIVVCLFWDVIRIFLRKANNTFFIWPQTNSENVFQLCATADYKSLHAGVLCLRSVTLSRYFDNSIQLWMTWLASLPEMETWRGNLTPRHNCWINLAKRIKLCLSQHTCLAFRDPFNLTSR